MKSSGKLWQKKLNEQLVMCLCFVMLYYIILYGFVVTSFEKLFPAECDTLRQNLMVCRTREGSFEIECKGIKNMDQAMQYCSTMKKCFITVGQPGPGDSWHSRGEASKHIASECSGLHRMLIDCAKFHGKSLHTSFGATDTYIDGELTINFYIKNQCVDF